jgi:hypothetical protein
MDPWRRAACLRGQDFRGARGERVVDLAQMRSATRGSEYLARLRGLHGREVPRGKGTRSRELFERFEDLIASCGPYEVAPATTRIAFMARVRFAGVYAISDRGMTIAFSLPSPIEHPRIHKIEHIAPGVERALDADHLTGPVRRRAPRLASRVLRPDWSARTTHEGLTRRPSESVRRRGPGGAGGGRSNGHR